MISVLKKTIILCAGAALALGAQAASIRVGYCDGALAEKGYGKTGKTEMSGAVILTPEMLEPYIGCNITAVRAGITTTEGMTGFNVWVRSSLDGENLESMERGRALRLTGCRRFSAGRGILLLAGEGSEMLLFHRR